MEKYINYARVWVWFRVANVAHWIDEWARSRGTVLYFDETRSESLWEIWKDPAMKDGFK